MIISDTFVLKSSRSLRKHELKPLLVKLMKQEQPDFRFLTFATGVFYFQRKRDFGDYELKEMLHLAYSFADHTMQASVSSRLNPVHTLNPIYNNGLINPHVDLVALKSGTMNNAMYKSDGSIDGVRDVVTAVIGDFKSVGVPYLDQRLASLQSNALIAAGLNYIKRWTFDKTMFGNELQVQLRKAKFNVVRVRHPLLNQFRIHLQSVKGQSREAQEEIPRLVFDLVELYCNRRIAAY